MNKPTISGLQNETEFSEYLNRKSFSQLGENSSKFIKQLYPEINNKTQIKAEKVGGLGLKPDVVITVLDDQINVSLKKGSGNSIHQEKTSLFLLFCKEELGMTDEVRDSFLAYLYGDGTLDGKGEIEDRLDGDELKKQYIDEIKNIQSFLDSNARPLIERFLVYGRKGKELNIKADYLYHGRIANGVWCPLDETVDFLVKEAKSSQKDKSSPAIGPLTLQTWNRNLKGVKQRENRRDSIQVKWGGKINEYISKINQIYLDKIRYEPHLAKSRIFGDNSHGFKNVREIAKGLNGCRVRNLRGSLLGLINSIFNGVALTDIISCKTINGKPDIQITIGQRSKNVSIFMGGGNSVHQEPFIPFLEYCHNSLNMNSTVENALQFLFYGDGTLDGTGNINDRIADSRVIKKLYPEKVKIVQEFFDKHRRELATRFLITGKDINAPQADYVFYGDIQKGISLSYNDVIDYIVKYKGKENGLLSIGPLSFQMWNRNISGNKRYEYKRHSLQIKWPSIVKHIKEADVMMKNKKNEAKINGITAEYELVSMLNQDKTEHNPLWNNLREIFNITDKNIFAIRVSYQVYSKFYSQTIYPKSDVYLCRANIDENELKNIDYALDEEYVRENNIQIDPILGSGISCKIPNSKHFTYTKISTSNFKKIFGSNLLAAGASLFVTEQDINLNHDVISGWGIEESDFLYFIKERLSINSKFIDLSIDDFKRIKDYCNQAIENIIRSDTEISDMIFIGKGLYDDPYYAPLIFKGGQLKINTMPDNISITTGSGRHKGKYTIVIKPK